jgi:hypothetical protein
VVRCIVRGAHNKWRVAWPFREDVRLPPPRESLAIAAPSNSIFYPPRRDTGQRAAIETRCNRSILNHTVPIITMKRFPREMSNLWGNSKQRGHSWVENHRMPLVSCTSRDYKICAIRRKAGSAPRVAKSLGSTWRGPGECRRRNVRRRV